MKKSVFQIIVLIALAPLIVSFTTCTDYKKLEKALRPYIKLDPDMTQTEKESVLDAIDVLRTLEIEAKRGSNFHHAFGGTKTKDVMNFLKTRISYITSDSALKKRATKKKTKKKKKSAFESFIDALTTPPSKRPRYGAANVGVGLFYGHLMKRRFFPARFKFGKKWINVRTPRVGIVKISSNFANWGIVYQMSALVHEARHSDCTGGLTPRDLRNIRRFGATRRKSKLSCGHLHVVCPWDKGEKNPALACDAHAWGANAIQVLFLDAVINDCDNCYNHIRKRARRLKRHLMYRILLGENLFKGKYGRPNMTSSGFR